MNEIGFSATNWHFSVTFIEKTKKGTSCQNFMAKQQTVRETQNMADMLTHAARSYGESRSPMWRQSDQKKGEKRKRADTGEGKDTAGLKRKQEDGKQVRGVYTLF